MNLPRGSALLSLKVINWLKNSIAYTTVELIEIRRLKGSTSSSVYNILFETEETVNEVVLRLLDNYLWLKDEPELAQHEADALNFAHKNNLASPVFIAIDKNGKQCGCPAVLMSKLQGEVVLKPDNIENWIDGLAKTLAQIHLVDPQGYNSEYFTYNSMASLKVPCWTEHKQCWEEIINIARKPFPGFKKSFIHRDYHPVNVLWMNSKVSGVVDWINACFGPAGIDVGHCRINLIMLYGLSVADKFLEAYKKYAGRHFIYDFYWDVISLVDMGINDLKIYQGWAAFGINNITLEIMKKRIDDYALSLTREKSL